MYMYKYVWNNKSTCANVWNLEQGKEYDGENVEPDGEPGTDAALRHGVTQLNTVGQNIGS